MTMMDDLVNRSPDIHWPQGFDPTQADLFSHNEVLINAKCERVWQHIIDATKWPDWYPNSKEVHIVGNGGTVLKEGTTFRWTTFGLEQDQRVCTLLSNWLVRLRPRHRAELLSHLVSHSAGQCLPCRHR
jgi:hypothetical protein